jgi:hypothetical protein
MNYSLVRRGIPVGMVVLLLATVSLSQTDQKFAESQRRNAMELRQYTWKSRIEIQKDGETRNVQLNLMRYDIGGTLQKTQLSSTPQQQLPTRGLKGRIAQKKKEDFMETLDSLGKLAKSYGELSPEAMQRFMATAAITSEMGPQQKSIRAKGIDVLQPGDAMSVWLDAVTRKLKKVEIQTALDRKPVRVVSEFQDLPEGPTYMARSIVSYPSEELTLITENFDYQRAKP